ncbi:5'-methylthioadenosine/S-adenosylhomocysteine nucleosidase [Buchnera aphidicola (Eriosoma grossulariae)]|uniref:5'-methylthioadenosine/adenosylhomocysteine nucleosidase n=1 Tax=Buchnera aphidicola TaxID=9 RepID=UPI003463DC6E
MIVGIVGAIQDEILLLVNKINNKTKEIYHSYLFHIGYYHKIKIIVLQTGIGKVSASIATTLLILLYKPNIIINIGSAGSIHNLLKPGDLIIPNLISYYDVNLIDFNYKIGQIPGCPQFFTANDKLLKIYKKNIIKNYFQYMEGDLVTGDIFVNNQIIIKTIKKNFPTAIAVEMESAAIAHVCYKFNIPFLIIRSISDYANKTGYMNFKKYITLSSKNNFNILEYILIYLNQNNHILNS